MNIWNKVFLGFIIATSLVVAVLGSVEYHIRSRSLENISKKEKAIAETVAAIVRIQEGTAPAKPLIDKSPNEWGLAELRYKVEEGYREQGNVWIGCKVGTINEKLLPPALPQIEAQITITGLPDERGIETDAANPSTLKGVVYVFTERDETHPCLFLGRFLVEGEPTSVPFLDREGNQKNGWQVMLVTSDPINEGDRQRIRSASQARWSIYTNPPANIVADIADMLTDDEKLEVMASKPITELTEEERQNLLKVFGERFEDKTMLPLTESERQWAATEGRTSEEIAVWEKYRAALDDPFDASILFFSSHLSWLYGQQSSIFRDINETEANIEIYKESEQKTVAENEKMTADCTLEEKRLDAMTVQRDVIKSVQEDYEKEIARMTLLIEKHQAMAAAYLEKIAEYQLQAVEKIESRKAKEETKTDNQENDPQT